MELNVRGGFYLTSIHPNDKAAYLATVRTILNRQRWNAGFSIITEANTNGGMRVSASASKNVRSIDLEHLNDKSISDAIPVLPYPYTEAAANWWIQHRLEFLSENGKEISFALRNPEGYLIGSVGVDDFKTGKTHRAEIGYWLARAYRRQGLASDALSVFVQYAFDNLEVTRLTAHTLDFNTASARILEKNRFKLEGCLRQHTRTRNGIFDTVSWGLLKGE